MTKKTPDAPHELDTTRAEVIAAIAAKPDAVELTAANCKTISYEITLGDKVLRLENVPVKDNTTYLQSQIISLYSGLSDGEYTVDGTDIKVTVVSN